MSQKNKRFKTEVKQLLDLMIHSLYSNKDIFLRELVANAADAIDKARFESLTNEDLSREWEICIESDKENGLLTVSDNGIGMSEEEVVKEIGTIARSGTKAFLAAHEKSGKGEIPELIGQFGVGFYSAFMVSDKVELLTKKAGADSGAVRWVSDGKSGYTVEEAEKEDQGTSIILHLNEESRGYLDEWKISQIIKQYSDFIEHPISFVPEEDDKEKKVLNSQKAIWLRTPSEISEDEHKSFFSHLSHFGGDPLHTIHLSAEGTAEFRALLYIPSKAPIEIFGQREMKNSLHLYIRRVFITDDCEALLPEYLRFVKGVVDSSDLPLNISREMLQDNAMIRTIRKNIVRKVLLELDGLMKEDREKYLQFYGEFGSILKEGIYNDFENREKLQKLAMYATMNKVDGKLVSFEEYISSMPPEQEEIYYLVGENRALLENSPQLESIREAGFDVIFMTDPVDEFIVQSLQEVEGKKLRAAGKGTIDVGKDKSAEKQKKKAEKEHKGLLQAIQKKLDNQVREVRFSSRLKESPCCLVGTEQDPSPYMEKIFKAMNQEMPETKRILELNPEHGIVKTMQKMYENDPDGAELGEYSELLYDQALLVEGLPVKDPSRFAKLVSKLMVEKGTGDAR